LSGTSIFNGGTCCWQPQTSRSAMSPDPIGRQIVSMTCFRRSNDRLRSRCRKGCLAREIAMTLRADATFAPF